LTDGTIHTIEQVSSAVDIESPHIKAKTVFIERWLGRVVKIVASSGKLLTRIICFTCTPNRMGYVKNALCLHQKASQRIFSVDLFRQQVQYEREAR
jgi:hypothetical protein